MSNVILESQHPAKELSNASIYGLAQERNRLDCRGSRRAHQKDLEVQGKHGVNYLKYWFNEAEGTVFCLVDAPSREAAMAVHREAHGLVTDDVVEVQEGS